MSPRDRSVPRNVSLYPIDWAAVHQVAKDYGLKRSPAVRFIIRDWIRLKKLERQSLHHPSPAEE